MKCFGWNCSAWTWIFVAAKKSRFWTVATFGKLLDKNPSTCILFIRFVRYQYINYVKRNTYFDVVLMCSQTCGSVNCNIIGQTWKYQIKSITVEEIKKMNTFVCRRGFCSNNKQGMLFDVYAYSPINRPLILSTHISVYRSIN